MVPEVLYPKKDEYTANAMTEKVKRLRPTPSTARELYVLSGNICAFPSCEALLLDKTGAFVGEICHIEAAEQGGPRFNPDMTNEDRRKASNLILLCRNHHARVDQTEKHSVQSLRKMKKDHQAKFSNPGKKILEKLIDWTRGEPTKVTNLQRLYAVIGLKLDEEKIAASVNELNEYIDVLNRIPAEVRQQAYSFVQRAHHMMGSDVVEDSPMDGAAILLSDLKKSHRISRWKVGQIAEDLEAYGVARMDTIGSAENPRPAVRLDGRTMEWFGHIDSFCSLTNTDADDFIEDLDFSPFDVLES